MGRQELENWYEQQIIVRKKDLCNVHERKTRLQVDHSRVGTQSRLVSTNSKVK